MTEKDAIRELECAKNRMMQCSHMDNYRMRAFSMAIKALEEVQQYRTIGTPEECRAAVEKQTAKQIIDNTPTEDDMWYQCPSCRGDLTKIRSFYCPYCGQKLSWNSKQYCSTCTWYDVDSGVCCNG